MIPLLTLILGLIVGYYARSIHDMLTKLSSYFKDRLETPSGVVRPGGTLLRNEPSATGNTDSGGVIRPNPDMYMAQNQRARDEALKNL